MSTPIIKAVIFTANNKFYGLLETTEPMQNLFCENSAKDLGIVMSYLKDKNSFVEVGFQSEFKIRVLVQNNIALGSHELSQNDRTDFVTAFSAKKFEVVERSD